MKQDDLNKILAGMDLDSKMQELFARYTYMLLDWNSRINLTAIRDSRQIYLKHHLDSLKLNNFLLTHSIGSIVDIGTGAGFPGIPLAIVNHGIKVYLVESIQKKVKFLCYVVQQLGLENVSVILDRAELLYNAPSVPVVDLVVGRAVFYLPIFLEVGYSFVKSNGYLAAFKSAENLAQEIQDAQDFIQRYNLIEMDRIYYSIEDDRRVILIYQRNGTTQSYKPRSFNKLKKIYKRG